VACTDEKSLPFATIRHIDCSYLLPSTASRSLRCGTCTRFRDNLRKKNKRLQEKTSSRLQSQSHVPYSYLSKEEMKERKASLQSEIGQIRKQRDRLRQKLQDVVIKDSLTVDQELNDDLIKIATTEGAKSFPTSSFQHLFWQQQLEAASCKVGVLYKYSSGLHYTLTPPKKDHRGMRWHPLMIRWCIYLRHQSQSAYNTLRESKCVVLPSQRTLRDYTHYIHAATGFSEEVDCQLLEAANLHTCEPREMCAILLLDEMHIRQDLAYNKNTGMLVGFVNLGGINSQLLEFEKAVQNDTTVTPLATTMMTFMVRGLFSNLQFPYAQFPCHKIKGDLLFHPFWEAVYRLERIGLKVGMHIIVVTETLYITINTIKSCGMLSLVTDLLIL